MNVNKKINVNFSSLVGLKAELLKKQLEVNKVKSKSENFCTVTQNKRKTKRVKENNTERKTETVEHIEDANTHKKSKLMLEAKAKLYEELKKLKNNNDNFLVDFTNKSDESEEETTLAEEEDCNDESFGNEDDWVEYEDCFGRTRKCLQEDLSLMQEKDNLLKQQIVNDKNAQSKIKENIKQTVVVERKEPEIEIMRRKWEDQTKKLADKTYIHYQDILFDEARTHGVGYYAFSQNEDERFKQQENLFNLRKETERKQKESKELKQLRERMEHNRLKAARIRQRIRAGLPIEELQEEREKNEEEETRTKEENELHLETLDSSNMKEEIEERKDEINFREENSTAKEKEETMIEKESKVEALGKLLGKKGHWYEMSQEEWIQKCRKARVNEFGPVYENFKPTDSIDSKNKKYNSSKTILNETHSNVAECLGSSNVMLLDTLSKTDSINKQKTTDTDSNKRKNQTKVNKNIDEASIAAGLRYLREKFEQRHNG